MKGTRNTNFGNSTSSSKRNARSTVKPNSAVHNEYVDEFAMAIAASLAEASLAEENKSQRQQSEKLRSGSSVSKEVNEIEERLKRYSDRFGNRYLEIVHQAILSQNIGISIEDSIKDSIGSGNPEVVKIAQSLNEALDREDENQPGSKLLWLNQVSGVVKVEEHKLWWADSYDKIYQVQEAALAKSVVPTQTLMDSDNKNIKEFAIKDSLVEKFPYCQPARGNGCCYFNAAFAAILHACVGNEAKLNILKHNLFNLGCQDIVERIPDSNQLNRDKVHEILTADMEGNIVIDLSNKLLVPLLSKNIEDFTRSTKDDLFLSLSGGNGNIFFPELNARQEQEWKTQCELEALDKEALRGKISTFIDFFSTPYDFLDGFGNNIQRAYRSSDDREVNEAMHRAGFSDLQKQVIFHNTKAAERLGGGDNLRLDNIEDYANARTQGGFPNAFDPYSINDNVLKRIWPYDVSIITRTTLNSYEPEDNVTYVLHRAIHFDALYSKFNFALSCDIQDAIDGTATKSSTTRRDEEELYLQGRELAISLSRVETQIYLEARDKEDSMSLRDALTTLDIGDDLSTKKGVKFSHFPTSVDVLKSLDTQKQRVEAMQGAFSIMRENKPVLASNYVRDLIDFKLTEFGLTHAKVLLEHRNSNDYPAEVKKNAAESVRGEELNLNRVGQRKHVSENDLRNYADECGLDKDSAISRCEEIANKCFLNIIESRSKDMFSLNSDLTSIVERVESMLQSQGSQMTQGKIEEAQKLISSKEYAIQDNLIALKAARVFVGVPELNGQRSEVPWAVQKGAEISTPSNKFHATLALPLMTNDKSVWFKRAVPSGCNDSCEIIPENRDNKFKVLDAVEQYKTNGDLDKEKVQNTFIDILKKLSAGTEGNEKPSRGPLTLDQILAIIDKAKDVGGISNKVDERDGSYSKIQSENLACVSAVEAKKFSKAFQLECEACGIYSGREGGKSVGLRLTFIPDDVVKKLEDEKGHFQGNIPEAKQRINEIKKNQTLQQIEIAKSSGKSR